MSEDKTNTTDLYIVENCLGQKLKATNRMVTNAYDLALKPTGLSGNQFTILVATSIMGPVSITDLSEPLLMDRTTLTRNLKPLEAANLIHVNDGFGRKRELTLSQKGVELLAQAKPLWKQAQLLIASKLGDDISEVVKALPAKILKSNL